MGDKIPGIGLRSSVFFYLSTFSIHLLSSISRPGTQRNTLSTTKGAVVFLLSPFSFELFAYNIYSFPTSYKLPPINYHLPPAS